MPARYRLVALSFSALVLLLAFPASSLAAQDDQPCPFTNDSVVSLAVGTPVQGHFSPGLPGYESCGWGSGRDDYTITRQYGAFAPGRKPLSANVILALPEAVVAQIDADLNDDLRVGRTLEVPGYQIAKPAALGYEALFVKDVSIRVDALMVRRGDEVFGFQVLDRPDAQEKLTALARAVLESTPVTVSPGVPIGDRPIVVADCELDAANAVADRLQRSDVSSINVIGGCHYVSIETSLDGSGFENATTAQQLCDFATEVAYSGGILGITVTDRAGHERASGANGEPCSGFP